MARNGEIAALRQVSKSFAGQPVLHNVSFAVEQGEALLITGPSGSGKSTSIRMIAGLETPTSGQVTLMGRRLGNLNQRDQQRLIAESVGYGQQDPALDSGLNVFENLTLTAMQLAGRRRRAKVRERAGELAIDFGIAHLLGRPADNTLSGGEKAKVALVRSLVQEPKLLILDEPTSAVDPAGTAQIYQTLRKRQQAEGLSLLMVSHDDVAAREIADREIVISSGSVIESHMY